MAQVTFVGAYGTVTGSCTLLDFGPKRLLVDCGQYQGGDELEARNWQPFPFQPSQVDGVLLTHAHLDHTGLLPRLVAAGFTGPIWCTRATRPLARLVLEDAAELQEEEARYAAKKGYSRHAEPRPLFDRHDAEAGDPAPRDDPFPRAVRALPGSTGPLVPGRSPARRGDRSSSPPRDRTASAGAGCFSGDVGRYDVPILVDPEPPEEAPDTVLLESTYGDRRHDHGDPVEALAAIIDRTFARGGSVLIPAFALGRTQDVLYHLSSPGRCRPAGRELGLPRQPDGDPRHRDLPSSALPSSTRSCAIASPTTTIPSPPTASAAAARSRTPSGSTTARSPR